MHSFFFFALLREKTSYFTCCEKMALFTNTLFMRKLFIWLSTLMFQFPVQAQTGPVENLVFEGAGIRGIAYAGVVAELEKRNVAVKRVGGTSAGGIVALLLSLGYRANEIEKIIGHTNFKKLQDGNFIFVGGINRLQQYFGWYRGKRIESWLSQLIEAKTGNAAITFCELKEQGYKDLYVTGTNLSLQRPVTFSFENYPHMQVRDAVRISMSIPLFFEAVFLDSTGRAVHHPKNKTGLHVMADGGILQNFPIRLFDSSRFQINNVTNEFAVNRQTIGFRIDRDDQIAFDSAGRGLAPVNIRSLKEYFPAFYFMMLENLNRHFLTADDWQRTVSISDGAVGPRIRKLSQKEIQTLVENGRRATAAYLDKRIE